MAKITVVCMDCPKVLESYNDSSVKEDSISHGLCNSCARQRKQDLEDWKKNRSIIAAIIIVIFLALTPFHVAHAEECLPAPQPTVCDPPTIPLWRHVYLPVILSRRKGGNHVGHNHERAKMGHRTSSTVSRA